MKTENNKKSQPFSGTSSAEKETNCALRTNFDIEGSTLLIAFGSMRLTNEVPPFEFMKTFKDMPAKSILVRDPNQYWYQRGLPGIATTIEGVGDYLQQLIVQLPVRKVVTFGGSMGGYAALYFGWYLAADQVHAFSPKTFLSPRKRLLYGDIKWRKGGLNHPLNRKILELHRDHQVNKHNLDLKRTLQDDNKKTKYCLYFSNQHRLDRLHCLRMRNIPGAEMFAQKQGGHRILNDMKKSGKLEKIISEAI
jgi:hypothetical protein